MFRSVEFKERRRERRIYSLDLVEHQPSFKVINSPVILGHSSSVANSSWIVIRYLRLDSIYIFRELMSETRFGPLFRIGD
jgi:hypothetical protein